MQLSREKTEDGLFRHPTYFEGDSSTHPYGEDKSQFVANNVDHNEYSDLGLPPPPQISEDFIPALPMTAPPIWEDCSACKYAAEQAPYEFVNRGFNKPVYATPIYDLIALYGFGYFVYFEVLRMAWAFTLLVLILHFIPYVWYLGQEQPSFAGGNNREDTSLEFYQDFFITGYTDDQKGAWMGVSIATMVFALVVFPILVWWRISAKRKESLASGVIPEDRLDRHSQDRLMRYIEVESSYGHKITVENPTEEWSTLNKILRILGAAGAFGGMILITVLFSYFGTQNEESNYVISLLIAVLVQILNSAYFAVGYFTTMHMPIETWTGFSKVYAAKLILFRVCQNVAVFGAKQYKGACAYYLIGEQFFFILLIDLTLGNVFEVIGPYVTSKIKFYIHQHTSLLVGATKMEMDPQFLISVEYLELFGRLYVLLMAVVVFPGASVLTLAGIIVDYWLDKWRLMKVSAVQRSRLDGTQRNNIAAMIMLATLFAFFTPYAGMSPVFSEEYLI